jgi:hypothetical protein
MPATIDAFAGTIGVSGATGDGGLATAATLAEVGALALASNGDVYFSDDVNNAVRNIAAATAFISLYGGIYGNLGAPVEGVIPTASPIRQPFGIAINAAGDIYIGDRGNACVRKVSIATGFIDTIAGIPGDPGTSGDGGAATAAKLFNVQGLALDSAGNLYIADSNRIRKVTVGTGLISTVAGHLLPATTLGDGGLATTATIFRYNYAVALDASDNLYIGGWSDGVGVCEFRIRKVDAGTGNISTIAGTGVEGYDGDGGLATAAKIGVPIAITIDTDGNVYFSDTDFAPYIRRIDADTGIITTVAGIGTWGATGDGGDPLAAEISTVNALVVSPDGDTLYLGDSDNYLIRVITGLLPVPPSPGAIGGPPLRLFDGVNDYPFCTIPYNQQIQIAAGSTPTYASTVGQIVKFQGTFYAISLDDSATVRGTVWRINPRSGQLSRLGNGFAKTGSAIGTESNHGAPWRLAAWNGRLWVVTNQLESATCAVLSIRPDSDTTWDEDKEIATSFGTGLVAAFGNLYVTFMYAAAATPKAIWERNALGTWTARATMVSAGYAGFFKPFVFDSKLFAFKQDEVSGSVTSIIATLDGTTWTEDLSDGDLNTLVGQELNDAKVGGIMTFKGNLYVIIIGEEPGAAGKILKRIPGAIGGTWTLQHTATEGLTGYGAVLTTLE